MLAVKENQGQLHDDVRDLFQGAEEFGFEGVPYDFAATLEKGHGPSNGGNAGSQTRRAWNTWRRPGMAQAPVGAQGSRPPGNGQGDRGPAQILHQASPAQRLLQTVRRHWSIENSLHWTLDVAFREDQCRVRKDHAPQNMALLRQISHNLLKNETSLKVGIQGTAPGRLAGRR